MIRPFTLRSYLPHFAVALGFALVAMSAAALTFAAPFHARTDSFAKDVVRARAGRMTVLVDTYGASQRMAGRYIPLRVAVAVTGKGRPIRLDRESFTLIDEFGHASPLAGYGTISREYHERVGDASLFRARPMVVGSQFRSLHRVSSAFFPAPGRATATSSVELPAFSWMRDVLYFPRPVTNHGQLTLRITSPDLKSPMEVPFHVSAR